MTEITYLSSKIASDIDAELMGPLGFSTDQLMELAGLSVACAVAKEYPKESYSNVLVVCGPGNNGGDGLVAARHLFHFGYKPQIFYPKRTDRQLYKNLVIQLEHLSLPFLSALPTLSDNTTFNLIIDAIFGFNFKGDIRPPFDSVITELKKSSLPLVSVDIPSGWDVDLGMVNKNMSLEPQMLVSLTAPKMCAKHFEGIHYLGGRFVPPTIIKKYNLILPPYPGTEQCVLLSSPSKHKL